MGIGNMIGWAVFGLVGGALARLVHPGRDPMNWVWTAILGICGAMVGGWIGSLRSGFVPAPGSGVVPLDAIRSHWDDKIEETSPSRGPRRRSIDAR